MPFEAEDVPPVYWLLTGDCVEQMRLLREQSVHCVVTSPPYFGLRDYGREGQIGLEDTPDAYVERLVEVFREVRRVLRDDGTVWLNLGDSYARSPSKGGSGPGGKNEERWGYGEANAKRRNPGDEQSEGGRLLSRGSASETSRKGSSDGAAGRAERPGTRAPADGLKEKDLIGIPWRVAFALQADGWYLRQDIIWHKPNPMPESVRDRCTKAHEYVFLLSKGPRYYYDHEAVKEQATSTHASGNKSHKYADQYEREKGTGQQHRTAAGLKALAGVEWEKRNRRSVWTVTARPYKGAHFATFPPALIEPCILAGCPESGIVLDPFGGSGTTAGVALKNGRNAVICELNPEYSDLVGERVRSICDAV